MLYAMLAACAVLIFDLALAVPHAARPSPGHLFRHSRSGPSRWTTTRNPSAHAYA